jgi:hypothetical protein
LLTRTYHIDQREKPQKTTTHTVIHGVLAVKQISTRPTQQFTVAKSSQASNVDTGVAVWEPSIRIPKQNKTKNKKQKTKNKKTKKTDQRNRVPVPAPHHPNARHNLSDEQSQSKKNVSQSLDPYAAWTSAYLNRSVYRAVEGTSLLSSFVNSLV